MDFLFALISITLGVTFLIILICNLADYGNNDIKDKIGCAALGIVTIIFAGLFYYVYTLTPIIHNKHVINTEYKIGTMTFNFSEPTEIDVTEKEYPYSVRQNDITIKTNTFILEK